MPSTPEFKRVFIDTSVWIDLMKSRERHHAAAVTFHKSLSPMTLRITSWGIVSGRSPEFRYHIGYREAARWLSLRDTLENQGFLQVVYPDSHMELGVRKVIDPVPPRHRRHLCLRSSSHPCRNTRAARPIQSEWPVKAKESHLPSHDSDENADNEFRK